MLTELKIQNLVLIESLHLQWKNGFTAITGETGAGKSIFINALKILSGQKVKADLIRQGQEQLVVEATFELKPYPELTKLLQEQELHDDASFESELAQSKSSKNSDEFLENYYYEIILERRISQTGKSRCRINGSVVSQSTLASIGGLLFDLHGQHQQQSLFKSSTHLTHLDGYAGLNEELLSFQKQYRVWRELHEKLNKLKSDAEEMSSQRDFLQYQLDELEKADLKEGEETEIEESIKLLSGREKMQELLHKMESAVDRENGVLDQVQSIQRTLEQFGEYSEALKAGETELQEAGASLESFSQRLRQYSLPDAANNPESIDQLHSRASQLQRLRTKYKKDLSELIKLRDQRRQEIDLLSDSSVYQQDMELQIQKVFETLSQAALKLQKKRLKASSRFEKAVNDTLKHLGMEHSSFQCKWEHSTADALALSSLSPNGLDKLEFFLAANPGAPAQPLQNVASGGEASRIMLAIKSILAESDPVALMVFDEIDTGIGGTTANRVGECLQTLGKHHQIFVITHLHQVASRATQQVRVAKSVEGKQTTTTVVTLSESERVEELARMMGDEQSSTTLEHAKQLLEAHHS